MPSVLSVGDSPFHSFPFSLAQHTWANIIRALGKHPRCSGQSLKRSGTEAPHNPHNPMIILPQTTRIFTDKLINIEESVQSVRFVGDFLKPMTEKKPDAWQTCGNSDATSATRILLTPWQLSLGVAIVADILWKNCLFLLFSYCTSNRQSSTTLRDTISTQYEPITSFLENTSYTSRYPPSVPNAHQTIARPLSTNAYVARTRQYQYRNYFIPSKKILVLSLSISFSILKHHCLKAWLSAFSSLFVQKICRLLF